MLAGPSGSTENHKSEDAREPELFSERFDVIYLSTKSGYMAARWYDCEIDQCRLGSHARRLALYLLSSHGETNRAMDLLHFEFLGKDLILSSPVSYNQARRGDRLFVGSRVVFVSYRREARSVVRRRL